MARRFLCSHIGHCHHRLSSSSFSSCSSAPAAGGIVIPELIHKVDEFSVICTSADGQHRNFSALGNFSGFYAPKIEPKANSSSVADLGFRGNNRLFCLRRAFSTNRRRNYSEDEDNDAAELFNSRGRGGGGGRIRGRGRGGGRTFSDNVRSNSGRRRTVDNFNGNGRFHGMSQRKDDFMEDSFASGRGTRGSGRGRISRHDSGRDYASNDRFGLEDDSEEESDGSFRPARRNEAFGRIKKYCEGSDDDDLDGLDVDEKEEEEEDSDEFNDSFSTQRKDHKGYQETRFKDIVGKFPLKQNNGNVKRNRPVSMFQDRDVEGPLSPAFDKRGMVHEENKNGDDDELGLSDQENDLYDEDSDESVEGDDGEKSLKKMGLRSHMDKNLDDDEGISQGSGGGGSRSLIDDEKELNELIDKEMISGMRFQDELLSSNKRGGGGSRDSGSDLRRSNSNRRGTTRGNYSSTRFERRRSFSESDEDDGRMNGFGSTRGRKGGSRGSYSGGRFERRNSTPESDEDNDLMDDFSRTRGYSKHSGSLIGSSVRRDRRHSLKASPARRGRFMSSMVGLSP